VPVILVPKPRIDLQLGERVTFAGFGYSLIGRSIVGYRWTLNGRVLSTEAIFVWEASESGTITLDVLDSAGDWSIASDVVSVNVQMPPPWIAPQDDREVLQIALTTLQNTETGRDLLSDDFARSAAIRFGDIDSAGLYESRTHTITISRSLRTERPWVLAAILAHELWHAAFGLTYANNWQDCVDQEYDAFREEALVWIDLGKPYPVTSAERSIRHAYRLLINDEMAAWIIDNQSYQHQCRIPA
jgi:hypothetical protein